MIGDECGLDEILFAILLEKEVHDVALCVSLLELDVVLFGQSLCLIVVCNSVKVDSCVLDDGISHGNALERLTEIDLDVAVLGLGQVSEHGFSQLHHALVIGVCLVEFHQRELRIVPCVDTLVTEYTADLVDALEASDDQSLEVQLERDTELDVLVQRIIVSLERPGCGTAGVGHQHRCLDFHESPAVEEVTDLLDDLGSLDEGIFNLGINDQVQIPLAIAHVGIGEAVMLLGQHLDALAEQDDLGGVNGDLARPRPEEEALDAQDIADVILLECLVVVDADAVSGNIDLDVALKVCDVRERSLTHNALEHHTAGDGDRDLICCEEFRELLLIVPCLRLELGFLGLELGLRLCRVVSHIVLGDDKGILALCLHRGKLLTSDPVLLADVDLGSLLGLCVLCILRLVVCHDW